MALGKNSHGTTDKRGRTPAQWYCLLAGIALLLAGIFGFIADATFDTSATGVDAEGGNADGELEGDSFLGFEVNGWHNLVHLASGLVLLAAANAAPTARLTAIAFGAVYGLVALIGLIDGNDVLGFIPVNPADNILHIALSALGIIAGLLSPTFRRKHDRGGRVETTGRSDRLERDGAAATDGQDLADRPAAVSSSERRNQH